MASFSLPKTNEHQNCAIIIVASVKESPEHSFLKKKRMRSLNISSSSRRPSTWRAYENKNPSKNYPISFACSAVILPPLILLPKFQKLYIKCMSHNQKTVDKLPAAHN